MISAHASSMRAADAAAAGLEAGRENRAPSSHPWSADPDAANYAAGWVEDRRPIYLGVNNVPIPTPCAGAKPAQHAVEVSSKAHGTDTARVAAIHSRLAEADAATPLRDLLSAAEAPEGASQLRAPGYEATLDGIPDGCEVHVRNLDSAGWLHRRLVASVEVRSQGLPDPYGTGPFSMRSTPSIHRIRRLADALVGWTYGW